MSGGIRIASATAEDRDDWDRFVAAVRAGDPLQAWGWGEVARVGRERPERLIARDAGGAVRGLAQVLVRDAAAGRRVLYVPHGPLWDAAADDAEEVLAALLGALRRLGREQRGIVVKLDPRAAPPLEARRLAAMLGAHGLRRADADLQARTTRILDLRAGSEALFAGLEKDTRNLVRRAAREGVTTRVVTDSDRGAYATFAGLLAETGARAGFRVRPPAAFEAISREFAARGDACLVLAELSGRAIAGCLALSVGPRAFYLYAASLREPALRHANGPYAVLWACVEALARAGRQSLDLWGVVEPGDPEADASWAGFSLFKRGFGGDPVRHPGTYDLVVSPFWYGVRGLGERIRKRAAHPAAR